MHHRSGTSLTDQTPGIRMRVNIRNDSLQRGRPGDSRKPGELLSRGRTLRPGQRRKPRPSRQPGTSSQPDSAHQAATVSSKDSHLAKRLSSTFAITGRDERLSIAITLGSAAPCATLCSPRPFSIWTIDSEVLAINLTTKDTKSTKKSGNEKLDAILELCHIETHLQSDLQSRQVQVGQQLGLVNSLVFLDIRRSAGSPRKRQFGIHNRAKCLCIAPPVGAGVEMQFRSSAGHCSYAESSNRGPRCRWTSMAQPITRFESPSNSIFVLFVSFVVQHPRCRTSNALSGERHASPGCG